MVHVRKIHGLEIYGCLDNMILSSVDVDTTDRIAPNSYLLELPCNFSACVTNATQHSSHPGNLSVITCDLWNNECSAFDTGT